MRVVITGSTKGLGLALAKRFLEEGDHVCICSRSSQRVHTLVAELNQVYPDRVIGTTVDVADYGSLNKLTKYVIEQWDSIDIWINNAGTTAYDKENLYDQDPEKIDTIVSTNLTGAMYGCKAAVEVAKSQDISNFHIFNVDGLGSDGRVQRYYTAYGSTKRAIPYLSKAINVELREDSDLEQNFIGIHTISPGMVLTELLLKNADASSRRVFNILAETPTTSADFLVPRIRDLAGTQQSGTYIKFLTKWRILWRFLTFWRYKNRFFDDDGELLIDLE